MAMIDLGEKSCCEPVKATKPKNDKWYPTIRVEGKKVPFGPDDVGSSMTAVVKLELTGCSMRKSKGDDTEKEDFTFDVIAIDFARGVVKKGE